jgi:hypothetical protein
MTRGHRRSAWRAAVANSFGASPHGASPCPKDRRQDDDASPSTVRHGGGYQQADDVQCGHGATTGAIDGELKFYLMARGIPAKEAETLLVQAFIGEAIDGIQHAALREALMNAAADWLATRG